MHLWLMGRGNGEGLMQQDLAAANVITKLGTDACNPTDPTYTNYNFSKSVYMEK